MRGVQKAHIVIVLLLVGCTCNPPGSPEGRGGTQDEDPSPEPASSSPRATAPRGTTCEASSAARIPPIGDLDVCPAWTYDVDSHTAILLVRRDAFFLTDEMGVRTTELPREGGDEREATRALDDLPMGSLTVLIAGTPSEVNELDLSCALAAALSAGYRNELNPEAGGNPYERALPCRLTDDFTVAPDGKVQPPEVAPTPPAPMAPIESVDILGACLMRAAGRCQEYVDAELSLARQGCTESDGEWLDGRCPRQDLVAVCDRSERYGVLRFFYGSGPGAVTLDRARRRCDVGVFRAP